MNLKSQKAFSLTELIIVLVIIALIFSAMAPIITKRHIAENGSIENIWNFVSNDIERNAYFDPGDPEWTSSIYVGMRPDFKKNNNKSAKLVINSEDIEYDGETYPQPQLQFRFSPNSMELSNGIDAGSLGVDGDGNISFGTIRKAIGADNTILGFFALANAEEADGIVAVGTGALENVKPEEIYGEDKYHITAVGSNAGYHITDASSGNGIYIGAGSGAGYKGSDIAIGYHSLYTNDSANAYHNIAIGEHVGLSRTVEGDFAHNILINNYATVLGGMSYNTIIGYGAYSSNGVLVDDGENDYISFLSAIGYNACSSIGHDKGFNTCLGYGSGSLVNGTPDYNTDINRNPDEHIFLGGIPYGFGGRGVVEVHTYGDAPFSAEKADVVFNSNLVLRGKLYTADSDDSIVSYKFVDSRDSMFDANPFEPKYYRCTSDDFRSMMLTYNVYVCTDSYSSLEDSLAPPRTINLLLKDSGTTSDKRLKENIVENNDGLDKILLIQPYNFTFKDDITGKPQVGVIAQDLQKIFPISVSKDDKGFLRIRWDEMFYALMNSIKELSVKVEKLAQKVTDLGKEISSVQSHQSDISKKLSSLDKRVKKLERK